MIVGYCLHGSDTKERLLGDDMELVSNEFCDRFKSIYEFKFDLPRFNIPKIRKDFYHTIDGFLLVSENVKTFCKRNKYSNLEFRKLPQVDYYWLMTHNIIEFDSKRRGTLFLNFVAQCKMYEQIIGANPVCLISGIPLGDNFFRTDISFGSISKRPLICVGHETKLKIESAKLNGVSFEKILDKYDKLPKVT